jgi:hypothetical protein
VNTNAGERGKAMKIKPKKAFSRGYRIRNSVTGACIHITMKRLLTFNDRQAALAYIDRRGLNPEIYYAEENK